MIKNQLSKTLTLLFILYATIVCGQTQAITEDGDTIYVYNNGT